MLKSHHMILVYVPIRTFQYQDTVCTPAHDVSKYLFCKYMVECHVPNDSELKFPSCVFDVYNYVLVCVICCLVCSCELKFPSYVFNRYKSVLVCVICCLVFCFVLDQSHVNRQWEMKSHIPVLRISVFPQYFTYSFLRTSFHSRFPQIC